jgi:hypothetical protein
MNAEIVLEDQSELGNIHEVLKLGESRSVSAIAKFSKCLKAFFQVGCVLIERGLEIWRVAHNSAG